MSASNKKKLRKQEAEAQMTKRQAAASKDAKKQKIYTMTFWVVIVLCVCITIGALLTNPIKNVVYKNTVAVNVGEYSVNAVELNYFYVDAINTFYNQYSSYISFLLSTSKPLDEQVYDQTTGESWADYFVSQAEYNIQSTYAVYDLAISEGYTLSEEDQSALESTMTYMSLYASIYGYGSMDKYLQAIYGNGANEESYREYYEKCLIAESYYSYHADSLEYDAEALSTYDQEHTGEFDSYTYASYYLAVNKFYAEDAGTLGEDGKTKTYTEEEIAAAVEAAKAAADSLAAGDYADLAAFDQAIAELDINKTAEDDKSDTSNDENAEDKDTEDDASKDEDAEDEDTEEEKVTYKYLSNQEEILYTSVNSLFRDWIIGKVAGETEDDEPTFETRKEGDLTVIAYTSGSGENEKVNGYYVLRYGSSSNNRINLVNVRHILVMFKNAEGKTYSDGISSFTEAQKKTAMLEANEILADFEAGEKTEEAFTALAKDKSDDTGSKTNGGLYEEVYPGQMVTNFNDWCFDETRAAGDYGVIETEYGYHVMYFVDTCETLYRDFMITETIRSEDMAAWYEALVDSMTVTEVNTKYVNKEMTIG